MTSFYNYELEADECKRNKEFEKAADLYISAAQLLKNSTKSANLYNEAGLCLFLENKAEESIELYTHAIELFSLRKTASRSVDNAICLFNRGNAYRTLDKIELAIEDYNAALKILNFHNIWYASERDSIYHARVIYTLARCKCDNGYENIDELLSLVKKAHSIAFSLFTSSTFTTSRKEQALILAEICCFLGELFFVDGNFSKALKAYEQSIDACKHNPTETSYILRTCNYNIARVYSALKQYKKAAKTFEKFHYFEEAANAYMAAADTAADSKKAVDIYTIAGDCFYVARLYDNALKCFSLAIEFFSQCKKTLYTADCAYCYYQRGNIYFDLKEKELASSDYEIAVDIYESLNVGFFSGLDSSIFYASALLALTGLKYHSEVENAEKLISSVQTATSLLSRIYLSDEKGVAVKLSTGLKLLSALQSNLGCFSEALESITRAIEILKKHFPADSGLLLLCYQDRAEIYCNLKNFQSAAEEYKNGINLILSIDGWSEDSTLCATISTLLLKYGDCLIKIDRSNIPEVLEKFDFAYTLLKGNNETSALVDLLQARTSVCELLGDQEAASSDREEIEKISTSIVEENSTIQDCEAL